MAVEAPGGTGATAHDLSVKKFGGPTRVTTGLVTVTTSGVRVLLNHPRRVFWELINRSAADISADFQFTNVAGQGFFIPAFGGTLSAAVDEDGELVTVELFAISGAGSVNLFVVEVFRT